MAVKQITEGRNKGRYLIDWRDEYGIRQYETLGYNKRAAEDILHKKITMRAELRSLDKAGASGMRFNALCDEYMEKYAKVRKRSWRTDSGKLRLFKAFFGNAPIESIKRDRVNDYANARRKVVDGGTVNKEIAILKKIFWYAVDNNKLEYNPAQRWQEFPENPAQDDYLEWGQYRALIEATSSLLVEMGSSWRARLHLEQFRFIIPLAYETGGRREEIVSLRKTDLDLEKSRLRYWYYKGKDSELKSRWVPFSEDVAKLLSSLPNGPDTAYVFPDENNGLWKSKISFYRQWAKITEAAKMPGLDFHRLRHSYCSQLANNGVDESTRMRLMGHTSPVTQQRYTHISEERKRKVVKVFDDLRLQNAGDSLATGAPEAEKVESKDAQNDART